MKIMATLETQYKDFLYDHPESKFTFEEWKEWFGKSISEAIQRDLCSTHSVSKVDGMCPKCMEESNK